MMNGMQYIRASVAEINGWEPLGAKGWNWDSLWPFYKDLESFKRPTPEQSQPAIDINPKYHGMTGDVAVSYPTQTPTGTLSSNLAKTWGSLGVSNRSDANGGRVEAYTVRPMMIDRDSGVRASAAIAFYYPVSDRKNLQLVQCTVLNLI
jgi:choline dehydrogenase